ncbi:unnamed protein product [Rotaria magnacalcarata]|uniref:PiggyBac transposable element-derived protein domain-containing protein n=1 Tax=Rotaria magnacalcarata TaxID=392030 RepID=A0A816P059_9BILA|nr:unnamed protein product [Rotaria magnacalcarata]CAF4235407.1 unnamed protein product [Rotaria magnacalcarata]
MYAEDLTFDIEKENANDDSESGGEEKIGAALSDSDIDEFESHLVNVNLNYQSEEYSDDDTTYAPRFIDKTNKPRNDENNSCESEEYSDDDVVYPNRSNISSSNVEQNINDNWTFVEPGRDQRSKALPNFEENIGPTFQVNSCHLPATFYNEMLPDSLFDHVVKSTNTRARVYSESIMASSKKQETWKPISRNEIKKFFALVVQMGMIRKRSISDYWSTNPLVATPIFHSSEYLSRQRFLFILRFLRFADCENLVINDRLQRIRPFLDQVKYLCRSKYVPRRNIAVDETLMLYKGRLVH